MPLLDHFRPPLSERRHWEGFHTSWASAIAENLNAQGLPEYFFAEPSVHVGGRVQIDVATFEACNRPANGGAIAVATPPRAATVAPAWVIPAVYPDSFEVLVINSDGGPRLAAAIELVSPSNKDRPETRRALAVKCANFLCQGIPYIVMDVVTNRSFNLHNETMELLQYGEFKLPIETTLYATSYRPVRRKSREEIDVWHAALSLGEPLPSLPLFLDVDLSIDIEFETTYQETCERLRLAKVI